MQSGSKSSVPSLDPDAAFMKHAISGRKKSRDDFLIIHGLGNIFPELDDRYVESRVGRHMLREFSLCLDTHMESEFTTGNLEALIQVSKTVNAHLDLDSVLESIMAVTSEVMHVEAASLALLDEETGDLLFHIAKGAKANAMKPIRMKPGEGIIGWVVQSGKSATVNNVEEDPRFFGDIDKSSGFHTRSILCVPMIGRDRLWGAIEVLNKSGDRPFDDDDLHLCEAIAAQAAIAVENAMLHRRIVRNERLAAIGQTVAGMAHCIKNVLNGIQGGAYMVDLGLRKENLPRASRGWEIVSKNNAFLRDLVLDMLTYSKEREPEYRLCEINDAVESICDLVSAKAKEQNVTVQFRPDRDLGEVVVDPRGIRRSILNLVSNAVDACADGDGHGRVDVTTSTEDSEILILQVSDNGCGIREEDREHLFQMFFSTKGSKGTGLGLAVTNKIILEHGGEIKVDSEVGVGTSFAVRLPLRLELESAQSGID